MVADGTNSSSLLCSAGGPDLQDHGFQFLEGRELGAAVRVQSQVCSDLSRGTLEPLEQVELRQPDDQARSTINPLLKTMNQEDEA